MKKKIIWIYIFTFLFLSAITFAVLVNYGKPKLNMPKLFYYNREKQSQVCFKEYCFNVELAVTPEERSRGLMYKKELDSNSGMLFIFEKPGSYPFWMKNTFIPLDIIWIDENGKIVFVSENAQPCDKYLCPSIEPAENAKYVLELNGGASRKVGLVIGAKLDLKVNK